jgi:hypothetical protein
MLFPLGVDMDLISLLVAVIVIGLLCWLVTMLPMPQPFKQIATVVMVLICIVWLLGGMPGYHHALLR